MTYFLAVTKGNVAIYVRIITCKFSGPHFTLKPQAHSLLFAAMLLCLQPIQIEEVDLVFQIGGLTSVLI